MPSERSAGLLGAAALAVCLVGSGCARTVAESSAASAHAAYESELEFWSALETTRVVTNDDALHGLLLLADGESAPQTFEERLASAGERGWLVGTAADLNPHESARVGMVAVAVCEILGLDGGLTMHVFGASPRYCTREIVFEQIIPDRTEHQALSGLEFMELLARTEDRRRGPAAPLDAPESEPAAEPDAEAEPEQEG